MKQKILLLLTLISALSAKELRWNWAGINLDDIKFPQEFLWGTATAAYQVEGHLKNNWSKWEDEHHEDGQPKIKNGDKCGQSCDHWNRYKEDFQLVKDLGLNSYRFSVEWSRVEPEEGVFDAAALEQYKDMCKELLRLGIKPMLTIHHFTNPLWFEDKGAFEKKENIKYLVRFAEKLFSELSPYVDLWCTINEPAVYISHGYFLGDFPPGYKDLSRATIALENILNAHVEIYNKLKSMPGGQDKQIGIVKQIFHFDPYNKFNPLDRALCHYLNHLFNESVMEFFQTGTFKVKIPFVINEKSVNKDAPKSNDFFGLNYYSNVKLKLKFDSKEFFEIKYRDSDIITDVPHAIYAEGIYRALHDASKLNVPIYITENGIADADDSRRKLFLKQYLWAVSKAISEGIDVRGYYYWSLMDNFEWSEGYEPRFGLYHVDYKSQERTLRPSSQYFKKITQNKQYLH
jgi:beta-glucosidase